MAEGLGDRAEGSVLDNWLELGSSSASSGEQVPALPPFVIESAEDADATSEGFARDPHALLE